MSLVPIVLVPLNIMCSKRWLMPVIPSRSLTEPTWATQPAATVGDSCRSRRRKRMPFGSPSSWTSMRGFSAAASKPGNRRGRAALKRRKMFMALNLFLDEEKHEVITLTR